MVTLPILFAWRFAAPHRRPAQRKMGKDVANAYQADCFAPMSSVGETVAPEKLAFPQVPIKTIRLSGRNFSSTPMVKPFHKREPPTRPCLCKMFIRQSQTNIHCGPISTIPNTELQKQNSLKTK